MEPAAASAAYKLMLDGISHYLEEMEAPRGMIDAMVATSSSEIKWVHYDHDGLEKPPSIAEWTDASCGTFTKDEDKALFELDLKKGFGLTTNEKMLLEFLDKKHSDRFHCELRLHLSHVDRLPPPDEPFSATRASEGLEPHR